MKILAISIASGDIYEDSDGPLKHPLDPAISRLNGVIEPAEAHRDNTILVCTAGYSRKNATKPSPERRKSLAEQLARYVQEHESRWLKNLIAKPLGWSTRSEVRIGVKCALRAGISKSELVDVIVASNWSHLIRIQLYTHMYVPKRWKVHHVRVYHPFSLLSHALEVPKLARDLIYAFRLHRRLKRRYG